MSCPKNDYYGETPCISNGNAAEYRAQPTATPFQNAQTRPGATAPGAAPVQQPMPPVMPPADQPPPSLQSIYYTAGYLRQFIGKEIKMEFLIGTSTFTDRVGTLLEVGASYVVIRPFRTFDTEICDLYSIKFVTIYYGPPTAPAPPMSAK